MPARADGGRRAPSLPRATGRLPARHDRHRRGRRRRWSALKDHLAEFLLEHGYEVEDFGNGTDQDYPDVAAAVAVAVADGRHERALLICGTGLGMAITANKVPGVRAATAHDAYSAERARKSNDAQVLTMGARVIAPQAAEKVLEHWLASEFEGGGSTTKVQKMQEVDDRFRVERTAR